MPFSDDLNATLVSGRRFQRSLSLRGGGRKSAGAGAGAEREARAASLQRTASVRRSPPDAVDTMTPTPPPVKDINLKSAHRDKDKGEHLFVCRDWWFSFRSRVVVNGRCVAQIGATHMEATLAIPEERTRKSGNRTRWSRVGLATIAKEITGEVPKVQSLIYKCFPRLLARMKLEQVESKFEIS